MRLRFISLTQFKNYPEGRFPFEARFVGITGPNGIGKTNLLDAIYYLSFTQSYFGRSDQRNIRTGSEGFRIEGEFDSAGQLQRVVCVLREGRKEFSIDGRPYGRFSEHIGRFPCVMICPDDISLITGSGEERRRYLDALLSQIDSGYLKSLIRYNRTLQQRNSHLRSGPPGSADPQLLDVYDGQLITDGELIHARRRSFLQTCVERVQDLYLRIAGKPEQISLTYESQLNQIPFPELLRMRRLSDLYGQRTGAGIHRDDIQLLMEGQPFKTHCSQGQRKSLLFALKLAEYQTLLEVKGFAPLLLLDDLFEKLDEQRMRNLLEEVRAAGDGQVFITDTHADRMREYLADAQMIHLPASGNALTSDHG